MIAYSLVLSFMCYYAPVKRVRSIVISLSVCLSVREHISGTAGPIVTYPLWPWLGPLPEALRYVMYFRFYGWRHVSGVSIQGRSLMSTDALFQCFTTKRTLSIIREWPIATTNSEDRKMWFTVCMNMLFRQLTGRDQQSKLKNCQ